MIVVSLFDGISCARVALGNNITKYYAAEICPRAIKIAKKNFPSTIHLGDVKDIKAETIPEKVDLLIGGSPCTDLSIAKKGRKGLEGQQSKLFWEYIRIKNLLKPKWFILENVASMSQIDKALITTELGVLPIEIDAALVSAQNRRRLFWTNIPNVTQPTDRKIFFMSILEHKETGASYIMGRSIGRRVNKDGKRCDHDESVEYKRRLELRADEKCSTLTSVLKDNLVVDTTTKATRHLTPLECERLQSLPDHYTEGISTTARYKVLANAFNVEVVKHLLSFLPAHQT